MLNQQAGPAAGDVIDALKDADASVRQQAVQTLAQVPADAATAVPALTKLFKEDASQQIRVSIVQIVPRYQAKAMPLLLEAIKDKDAQVRQQALWAMQNQPGLAPPCSHEAIVVTEDLRPHERLKLFILNLGHSYLAELWARRGGDAALTVREAMADATIRAELDDVYGEEVLPAFAGLGMADTAHAYHMVVMDRFLNPFLDHRLADIKRASCRQNRKTPRDVGAVACAWRVAADHALRHQNLGRHLVGANEPEPVVFEDAAQRRQEVVVAAAKHRERPRQ